MRITLSEQRELADVIARRLWADGIQSRTIQTPDKARKEIADVAWNAIEDYASTDETNPDILHAYKEKMEAGDEASDPQDFQDHYFTRSL